MTIEEYNIAVDEYADRLYRFVLKTMGDEDVSNDIVQETYAKLWEKIGNVNYLKVKSYLFTAAYRLTLNFFRDRKKIERLNIVNEQEYRYEDQYSDLKEILNKALEELPKIQKTVILLRDYEGYNYAEIAEITDLNESQVKVYIYRGRKSLKEKIGSIDAVL